MDSEPTKEAGSKCISNTLRRRLLREKDLKLSGLLDIARSMEGEDNQAAKMVRLAVNTGGKRPVRGRSQTVTACSHYRRPSMDLIDFAWGACEIFHCGSVRPFGSVACVKKLGNGHLFRQRRIRRPIRSRLFKFTQRVSWIQFAITSRKNPAVIYF